nr:serine hydrolase [Geminocystis sp. NIES-3709]
MTSENKSNDSLGNVILSNVFRLAIIGVGMGTIFGSILANIDLTKPLFPDVNLPFIDSLLTKITQNKLEVPTNTIESQRKNESEEKTNNNESLTFTQELGDLKNKFIQLKTKYPNLEPGAFFVDLDNGSFVNFNGTTTFSAASTIKIPILVAFFQDVDAGKIYLDEQLATSAKNIGSGSGGMQYQPIGTKYTAIHTATEMIINSDNTATNMIIERLGGKDELNKRFKEWGLDVTLINNSLPDLEGTNTTSPKDLAITLAKVNQGELISLRSRDRLLDIMRQTRTRTLLPQGIEKDATIAHKTGDIGTILGDAGIVDIPTGKRYIGGVLVKRPYNDYSARTLIQEISRTAYQHFKWYQPRPSLQTSSNASNTTSSN